MRHRFISIVICFIQGILLVSISQAMELSPMPAIDPNERLVLIQKITKIIKEAKNVNAPDESGRPPIILTAMVNDEKLMNILITGGADIQAVDSNGNTALHIAVRQNHLSLVEYLLDKGSNINAENNCGQTPLFIAVYQGNKSMAEYLLGRQAVPDAVSGCSCLPLRQAIINGDYPMMQLLLRYHPKLNVLDCNGQAPLHLAIEQNDPNVAAVLLEQKADANLWTREGITPLDIAVSMGNKKIIMMLVENGAEVNRYNSNGQTALYIACESLDSDPEVVSLLLQAGANPNLPTPEWIFPLRAAKVSQRKAVVDILKKYNAVEFGQKGPSMPPYVPREYVVENVHGEEDFKQDDNTIRSKVEQLTSEFITSGQALQYKDEYGYTLLHWTLSSRNDSATRKLIEQGADVNAVSIGGTSPLIIASENFAPTSIIRLLLEKGADVKVADFHGWTALHWAARNNPEIIPVLIQAGADINAKTIFSATPLWEAVYGRNTKAVKLLLDAGSDIEAADFRGTTPLMAACNGIGFEIVQLLVEKGAKINAVNLQGQTPLLISYGRKEIPEYLISKGAEITVTFNDGTSLLHRAAREGNIDLATLLLQKGINVNILTRQKQTPLHWAAYAGNEQMVKLLLESKADPSLKDFEGKTARDFAEEKKQIAAVKLLDPEFAKTIVMPTLAEQRQQQRKARHEDFANDRAIWLAADSTPLHKAAISNDPNQVKKLLAEKADPNVFCTIRFYNVTPLFCAAYFDHEEIVRYMISQGVNPNQFDPKNKMTALHYAISNKHVELVEWLLNNGVDFKLPVYKDNPPLRIATSNGTVEIIKMLTLKGGTDVGSNDAFLQDAVYSPGTLESLILGGASVSARNNALFRAISAGQMESVKILLKYGADVNAQDSSGQTPLCEAITTESVAMINFLIEQHAGVNIPDKQGRTPIWPALRSVEFTKIMLNAGADLNIVDKEGESLIHELSDNPPEKDTFIGLINLFAQNNVNLDVPDKYGKTLLLRMIPNAPLDEDRLQDRLEMINLLLEKKVNVNHQDNHKRTPVFCSLDSPNTKFLEAILDAGANMETTDQNGYTPLLWAIQNNSTEYCRLLIEKGANVNAKTPRGLTCLKLANLRKNTEIADLLKSKGAVE